jgi:ABC-type microcin C transport system permease subunit YejB
MMYALKRLLTSTPFLMALVVIAFCLAMVGCAATPEQLQTTLDNVDYGCARVQIDGYFTDSNATVRLVKVPEGTTVDSNTLRELCQ